MSSKHPPKYVGVTNLIKRWQPEFDREAIAQTVADNQSTTMESVLEDWDIKRETSIVRGNAVHKYIENHWKHHGQMEALPGVGNAHCHQWADWYSNNARRYSFNVQEYDMRNTEYLMKGTFDQLARNLSSNAHVIIDWKTGKFTLKGYHQMLPPFDHLSDCSHVIYSLQLHIYAWMYSKDQHLIDGLPFELFCIQLGSDQWLRYNAIDLADEAKEMMEIRLKEISQK